MLAVGLAVAGCGSSGEADTRVASLTKEEFLKKANVICARGTKEIGKRDRAAWNRYDPPPPKAVHSEAELNKVALALLPPREKELRLIRAVGLPRGDEKYVEKILTAWAKGIEKGKEDPASLRAPGPEYAFYKSYSMGIDYGLVKCWLA